MRTYYIVPAWSEQAGRCRIVAREGDIRDARTSYREHPELWREAGVMNSRGELVCLSAPRSVHQEFKDCEPLMAGTQITGE